MDITAAAAGALDLRFLDVGDVRDVEQRDLGVGEERRAEDGQDGVLVARGRDGAAEGFAAVDDEVGHRVG